jgi:hypothetical protein
MIWPSDDLVMGVIGRSESLTRTSPSSSAIPATPSETWNIFALQELLY